MSNDKTTLAVYKSPRHDMMYLYLPANPVAEEEDTNAKDGSDALDVSLIPAELLQRFGPPVYALTLELWPERPLAQADAAVVLNAVATQGFYLQLPPKLTLAPTPDERNVHS